MPRDSATPHVFGKTFIGKCVKWDPRGYGFLEVSGLGTIFVHPNDLLNAADLQPGDVVSFSLAPDRRHAGRMRATAVSLLDETEALL